MIGNEQRSWDDQPVTDMGICFASGNSTHDTIQRGSALQRRLIVHRESGGTEKMYPHLVDSEPRKLSAYAAQSQLQLYGT